MLHKRRRWTFYIILYFQILSQDLKSKMSYRADFWISMIGMVITNCVSFFAIMILFENINAIGEWNYYEMLFLYGFSVITTVPAQCFLDNGWNLGDAVLSGDFIKYCLRPINSFFYFFSETFDVKGIGQFVWGIIILGYSWKRLLIPASFVNIVFLFFMLLSASLFMSSIMIIAAASSFWITCSGDILILFSRFKEYARYPISIFNPLLKFVFSFVIPIAFIAYYPSMLFIQTDSTLVLSWLTPIFGVLFLSGTYLLWMKGAQNYTGTGS